MFALGADRLSRRSEVTRLLSPKKKGQRLTRTSPDHKTPQADDEPPPFLGTWGRIYAFVLIHLALWILVFYFFTERFHSPS